MIEFDLPISPIKTNEKANNINNCMDLPPKIDYKIKQNHIYLQPQKLIIEIRWKRLKMLKTRWLKKKTQKNVYSGRVFVKLVNWSEILQK